MKLEWFCRLRAHISTTRNTIVVGKLDLLVAIINITQHLCVQHVMYEVTRSSLENVTFP